MQEKFNTVSTEALKELLPHNETVVIDTRPVDAYNGWKLFKEMRGGHIAGARSFPSKWEKYLDSIEIVRSKGILPEHKLILYGYNEEEVYKVAKLFRDIGHNDINIYLKFADEWSANSELPMDYLPDYQNLVYPQWVYDLLNGKHPPEYKGNNFVIFHAHYGNYEDYEEGHIPGAISLNTNGLEASDTWNRRPPWELKDTLQKHGITHDTTVIVYGRFSAPDPNDPYPGSSAGQLGAIRCAIIMLYAGVKDVKLLNGGLQSWEDEGYELSTREIKPQPVEDFGVPIPQNPGIFVDTPEAKELLASDSGELVSVRSWDEWTGKTSGYNYIEPRGRIPGAVFGNCGSDPYHMENYRNLDHTTRVFHEIAQIWQEARITPDKNLAFYCGTGWRGSEAFFNAYLMGWLNIAVYDGGWFEWSSDPANPVETGIPAT